MTVPTVEIQKLAPSALVEFFALDYSALGGTIVYFHAGTNQLLANVVWQGQTYTHFPVEATGFEKTGRGTMPQPKVRVANIDGAIGALCKAYSDLVGGKLTRKRTFVKYLDAINFPGGINPTADPTVQFADEIWFVNRKATENFLYIDFDLASASDVSGVQLPRRQCIANVCAWTYRSAECSYAGGAVADVNDIATSSMGSDVCGKRLASCKLRFGAFSQLPFGGFPAAGLVR